MTMNTFCEFYENSITEFGQFQISTRRISNLQISSTEFVNFKIRVHKKGDGIQSRRKKRRGSPTSGGLRKKKRPNPKKKKASKPKATGKRTFATSKNLAERKLLLVFKKNLVSVVGRPIPKADNSLWVSISVVMVYYFFFRQAVWISYLGYTVLEYDSSASWISD